MQNIALLIEYDGSGFYGWQIQDPHLPTIQGSIEAALARIEPHPVQLAVAGRTDAGVHAYGQVANFTTPSQREARRYVPALNYYLPPAIRIHRASAVPLDFNARHNARAKRYRYRLYNGPMPPALERSTCWHLRNPLDVASMEQAAAGLLGEHDFEAFRSVHCDAAHAIRRIHAIEIRKTPRPPLGWTVDLTFYANAFCRHMCRILAGSLVEVGQHKRSIESLAALLQGGQRGEAGPTAPGQGLTLLGVEYPEPGLFAPWP